MNKEWQDLYDKALAVVNPIEVSEAMYIGSVGAAILSKSGNVYTGICIDTNCSLGMCAERNALSTMLTNRDFEVDKVVAVYQDGRVLPPCGACREFMLHLKGDVKNIEILMNNDGEVKKLDELMPNSYL